MFDYKQKQVQHILKTIFLDELQQDILSSGIITTLSIKNDIISIILESNLLSLSQLQELSKEIEMKLSEFEVQIAITAHKPKKQKITISGAKKIIAISSCKGGVGKSTITCNLAIANAKQHRTAIVDLDVYGPNVPLILGVSEKPEYADNLLLPIQRENLYSLSVGYLIPEDEPIVWRGPMLTKMLHQLLIGAKWQNIETMFLDMPPGTGDIALSLCAHYQLSGVILVTTPDRLAINELKKTASMYRKFNIPILGMFMNMSYFIDPVSNNKNFIFGQIDSAKLAKEIGAPLLAELPISNDLSAYFEQISITI